MEKISVRNGKTAQSISAKGKHSPREVAYAMTPQFPGTMGNARPAKPNPDGYTLRGYYTGSLC